MAEYQQCRMFNVTSSTLLMRQPRLRNVDELPSGTSAMGGAMVDSSPPGDTGVVSLARLDGEAAGP